MAPAQLLMDINPESKLHYATKVASDNVNKAHLANSDEKGSKNCKDSVNAVEAQLGQQIEASKSFEDVEVHIIESTSRTNIDAKSVKAEDPDETECSSSFANTTSDQEKCSGLSDAEVESQFFGDDALPSAYDAFSNMFQMRKKKLTSHWRSFIRPLMWRCKWTELRIKEVESQALKYARELEAFDQRKISQIDQSTMEGFDSKSMPFSGHCFRKKALKRRRRKRVEDTTDLNSYMSHHNLFSYLEYKKSNADGIHIADDFGNAVMTEQRADFSDKFGINDNQLILEFGEGDNSLEQILWKMEIVHSRVRKLRNKLDLLMSKNSLKFSSSENLSLLAPCEVQTCSAPSPTISAGNGDTFSLGAMYNTTQHNQEYEIGDLVMAESAISSYGEAFHVPDIIESTVGLLSSADVTFHQPQIGDSCEDIVDNVLIHNGADGEGPTSMRTNNQSIQKCQQPEKCEEGEISNPSLLPTSEPQNVAKDMVPQPQEQSTLRSCLASDLHFPRNKRKRGERKAASDGWSKRHSVSAAFGFLDITPPTHES